MIFPCLIYKVPFNHRILWSVADLQRGEFKQPQYGRIILSFTLLRRLKCGLSANKLNIPTSGYYYFNPLVRIIWT